MPQHPEEFAALFGAKLIGEVPDTGAGPFGIARLAHIMHQRLTPGQGERPGRPTDATWESRPKVPMSASTRQHLDEIAKQLSSAERQVSPMQVAAQLLEEAVLRVKKTAVRVGKTKKNGNGAAAIGEGDDSDADNNDAVTLSIPKTVVEKSSGNSANHASLRPAKVKKARPSGQPVAKRRGTAQRVSQKRASK